MSPAGTPDRARVERGIAVLAGWGLDVQLGPHGFDTFGHYLAGSDADRLRDLNDAFADPGVRAVFATRGGTGSYRIADGLDFDAVRADPKPLVGFSDISILHLAMWQRCRIVGFHGPLVGCWDDEWYGPIAAESLRRALMTLDDVVVERDSTEPTSRVMVPGTATGLLLGGNLEMLGTSVGWCCPSFDGAILLMESVATHNEIGNVDRSITQLINSGMLDGVRAVALGQFTGYEYERSGKWTVLDVLEDRLGNLGVPVCGGFPVGHGKDPRTLPLGTPAFLDAASGTLRIGAGVTAAYGPDTNTT